MDDKDLIARFRAEKRITDMMKYSLDILNDIRSQQSIQIEKLGDSLLDHEEFIEQKTGIQMDLAHLAKHAEFLDEKQLGYFRKKILDYGGNLRRDL